MTSSNIPDIQSQPDTRNMAIDMVGIRAIRRPIIVKQRIGDVQHTSALFNMAVSLPAHFKGTHMSRFIEVLEQSDPVISFSSFEQMIRQMITKLDAIAGEVSMEFPYFISKTAPISGVSSLMDYQVTFEGKVVNQAYRFTMKVAVPVTSLCPCSKEISQYGAHNQRSMITISVQSQHLIWVEELISIAEQQASCELFSLLKRPDEKHVTEKAYENPKFVEDIVRDIAVLLDADNRIQMYTVESENFESIHNHSAYAMITRKKL